jgi:hypothetical protein
LQGLVDRQRPAWPNAVAREEIHRRTERRRLVMEVENARVLLAGQLGFGLCSGGAVWRRARGKGKLPRLRQQVRKRPQWRGQNASARRNAGKAGLRCIMLTTGMSSRRG